jgi:hypothetical protein
MTTLVINDAVPAARTFTVRDASMSSTLFVETGVASTFAGQARINYGLRPARNGVPARVDGKLSLPIEVTNTDTGEISVEEIPLFSFRFLQSGNLTESQRDELFALAKNLVAHAVTEAYVVDSQPVLS